MEWVMREGSRGKLFGPSAFIFTLSCGSQGERRQEEGGAGKKGILVGGSGGRARGGRVKGGLGFSRAYSQFWLQVEAGL